MGFLGVKTYRKRLTGAVRSFLSYSKLISGRFGENKFFNLSDHFSDQFATILDLIWPCLGPKVRTCVCICHVVWFDIIGCDEHLFLRPIYPYIFDICFWIPGIHVYLSTRYLWVSVDQISMSICDFVCQKGKQLLNCWSLFLSFMFFQNHFWRFIIFFCH